MTHCWRRWQWWTHWLKCHWRNWCSERWVILRRRIYRVDTGMISRGVDCQYLKVNTIWSLGVCIRLRRYLISKNTPNLQVIILETILILGRQPKWESGFLLPLQGPKCTLWMTWIAPPHHMATVALTLLLPKTDYIINVNGIMSMTSLMVLFMKDNPNHQQNLGQHT